MPNMQERIDAERARLEREKWQQEQEAQAKIANEKAERERYIAKIEADERHQLMLKAAHDPLLIEALKAYFAHLPEIEHKWVERSLFGIFDNSKVQDVLHKFRHSIGSTGFDVPYGGATVRINGILISWHETRNYLTFKMITEIGDDIRNEEQIEMRTVEEVASFIARRIAENRRIKGLRADQP